MHLNEILRNLYQTDFFEDVNVEIQNNILNVVVKEYPFINQLIIFGEKTENYKKQIKKIINLKEKRSFIKSYINSDINKIKTLYSSAGYNSPNVEIKTKKVSSNSFDVLIEIDRGQKTKIKSIKFIGNENISNRRLKDVVASEENKFWKVLSRNTNFTQNLLDLDTRLLRNFYKSSGYYDVKINSKFAKITDTGEAELTSIEEGERYTINKISTNVDETFNKELFFPLDKIYAKYIRILFTIQNKKILDDLDKLIDKNNLQFVEHNAEEIKDNTINITLNVFEGEKQLVERVNIFGNSVTNESVVRSELLIDEGDPLSKLNLEKSISEIKSRRIFKDVTYKIENGSKNNLKIININVEEQPTGEITAGAGIGTDGGLFAIGVKENNWLGTGKSLALTLRLIASLYRHIKLR